MTIEIVEGRGAERTTKEVTMPVDKLSKTCQSRVRQIDAMQKKLKEMAARKPGENGAVGPASPMADDPGGDPACAPGRQVAPALERRCRRRPAAARSPIRARSEPDPLGFAEVAARPRTRWPPGGEAGPPGGGLPPAAHDLSATVAARLALRFSGASGDGSKLAALLTTAGGFHSACAARLPPLCQNSWLSRQTLPIIPVMRIVRLRAMSCAPLEISHNASIITPMTIAKLKLVQRAPATSPRTGSCGRTLVALRGQRESHRRQLPSGHSTDRCATCRSG